MRASLLCALCACWHSEPPPPAPALVPIRKPPPSHERELDLQPGNDQSQLSTFLSKSRDPITALVDGPVVTVDATGTVDTLCGAFAEDVVRRWTASVRDPDAPMLWCEPGKRNGYTLCMHWESTTHSEFLILFFRYNDGWQLSAMVTGPINSATASQTGPAMFAALSAAHCP